METVNEEKERMEAMAFAVSFFATEDRLHVFNQAGSEVNAACTQQPLRHR
jgi:hypothetical protein